MKQQKIIVLGGGLVGGPMALDLADDVRFAVTVADVDEALTAISKSAKTSLDMAGAIQRATGTTDESGTAMLSVDAAHLPADAHNMRGVQQGLFRVQIHHSNVKIPSKYNTETELGREVSFETGENFITFSL